MRTKFILTASVIVVAVGLALSVRQVFLKSRDTSYVITGHGLADRILIDEVTNEACESCFLL